MAPVKGLAEAETEGTTHTGTTRSIQVDDSKWFLYNLLEFSLSLACVAGAKREVGGRGEGHSLSPFLPIPYPFRSRLGRQLHRLPLLPLLTPATQVSSLMAFQLIVGTGRDPIRTVWVQCRKR